jgi:hypothetical protein
MSLVICLPTYHNPDVIISLLKMLRCLIFREGIDSRASCSTPPASML